MSASALPSYLLGCLAWEPQCDPLSVSVFGRLCEVGDSRRQTRGSARVLSLRGSKSAVLWGGHSCLLTTNIEGLSPFYDWKRHQSFFCFWKTSFNKKPTAGGNFLPVHLCKGPSYQVVCRSGMGQKGIVSQVPILWADVLRLHTWSYFDLPACPMLVGEAGSPQSRAVWGGAGSLQTSIRAAP